MQVTRLWFTDKNGQRRLMNTIHASSLFFGFNAPKNLHLKEQRVKCAEILRDGWINQGQMSGTWEIEEGESDAIVLSKMVDDLLRGKEHVF